VIIAAQNTSEEDRKTGTAWVENLATHENTGLFLPFGYEFHLQGIEGRIRDPIQSIQHHSEQITRSVLAMFLNLGSTQTGSRALGNSFLDFFHLSLNATASLVCDAINGTTIRRLVDYNFERGIGANGKKRIPYPRLSAGRINVVNPLEMITLLKDVAHKDVDLLQPDDETENALREQMGLPPKATARERKAPTPVMMPGMEGGETGDSGFGTRENGDADRNGHPSRDREGAGNEKSEAPNPKSKTKRPDPNADDDDESLRTSPKSGRVSLTSSDAASASITPGGRPLSRPLHPHERKHDFDGHCDRQEKTARAVARLLRQAKPALIREAAQRAAALSHTHLSQLSVPFDQQLCRAVEKAPSCSISRRGRWERQCRRRAFRCRAARIVRTWRCSASCRPRA
jgi:hypothetical protein